jgi:hypothetical protein
MVRRSCFLALVVSELFALLISSAVRVNASPYGESAPTCETGTVASYVGTSCSFQPVVYHWESYSCTSTPASICDRLGRNGSGIHVRLDPNGPPTLLIGGTHLWDVQAHESVDIVIRGSVSGATVNLTWPHFWPGQPATTGDGSEENITTVECGPGCGPKNQGVSATRCSVSDAEENCSEHRITTYFGAIANFRAANPESPYPMTIEVKLSGGNSGSANIRSLGLHVGNPKRH